jgi:hypothetical protein
MKLIEIHTSPSRNENNDQYVNHFDVHSPIVYTHLPTGFVLKRSIDEHQDVRYGLFDPKTLKLISYAHFSNNGDGWYVSLMPSTDSDYQKQGWISLIFDYAVNHDHIKIMSDEQQTPEAKKMWRSLKSRGMFDVEVYNIITKQILSWTPENDPYSEPNEDTHRLIAVPRNLINKHINESIGGGRGVRAERRQLGIHDYNQYGPGTSNEDLGFINW